MVAIHSRFNTDHLLAQAPPVSSEIESDESTSKASWDDQSELVYMHIIYRHIEIFPKDLKMVLLTGPKIISHTP